ncbi:MAG: hypothetical protein KGJ79_13540 [Alphaproteobacteria bacterium]|nr:hypothetical protein [Alphaproteobacteria bacterium]MDE2112161.1 hypothetical protein [Alphaproteobacteria bacterium]MDE2495792.1 hypothetical protein [Alphaproteobacteria bacterium]
MQERDAQTPKKNAALTVWSVCVALLLGPALLVWIVRGTALGVQCAPGPELCRGMMLGGGLRDALSLSWIIGTSAFLLIALSLIATLAAFTAHRPLLGTLSMLLLPILAPVLPMLAVYTAKYDGCPVSTDGIGSCVLWGAKMGMSFHTAAGVPDLIYGIADISFALTVVLGILGWCFARPRPKPPTQAAVLAMRRFDE